MVSKVLPATATVRVRVIRSVRLPSGIAQVGEEHELSAYDARPLIASHAVEVVEGRAFTTIREE